MARYESETFLLLAVSGNHHRRGHSRNRSDRDNRTAPPVVLTAAKDVFIPRRNRTSRSRSGVRLRSRWQQRQMRSSPGRTAHRGAVVLFDSGQDSLTLCGHWLCMRAYQIKV